MKKITLLLIVSLLIINFASAELVLERKFSLGGKFSGGNTETQALNLDFSLDRNQVNQYQFTVKGEANKESNAGVLTAFNGKSIIRLAYSLTRSFYNFYRLDLQHDQFQDINLRLIPTIGIGYWFVNEKEFKSKAETAAGYQKQYLIGQGDNDMAILRLSYDLLWGFFTNDFDLYTSATNFNDYRATDTAELKYKMNSHYALKAKLKYEYDNIPVSGIKKDDYVFTTSIEYSVKDVLK